MKRINWIDWSKSICMFLVILGHTHLDDSGLLTKRIIYTFHMPLFFFISGLLCKNQISIQSIKRDTKFVLIPYLTFGIIGIFIPYPLHFQEIPLYISKLITGADSSIGTIWFLPAIFLCKMMGSAIISLFHQHRFISYVILALSFLPTLLVQNIDLPFFASQALCGLPFFLLGHKYMEYSSSYHITKSSKIAHFAIFIISTLLTIYLANRHSFVAIAVHSYGNDIFMYYINAIIGISSVMCASMLLDKYEISFVTATAYGSILILWVHGVFLALFHYYLFRFLNIGTSDYPIWTAILFSILSYVLSYGTTIIIDRHCPLLFGLRGCLSNLKGKK